MDNTGYLWAVTKQKRTNYDSNDKRDFSRPMS